MVPRCLKIAEEFVKKGVDIEVVDVRTLVPLDKETIIASARKTGKVLVVYEAPQTGGFGGEIVSVIADSDAFFFLDAPIKRLGGLDTPIPYNPKLEAQVVPTEEKITAAVESLL
jgi:pyruvate dehydrogenase E1 component beta subunit